jgi:hypothetical protein
MENNRLSSTAAFDAVDAVAEIAARNRIRLEAGLPLLSEANELQRYRRIAEEARFKKFYEIEILKYAHLWNWTRGWMHNMRINAQIGRQIGKTFNAQSGHDRTLRFPGK